VVGWYQSTDIEQRDNATAFIGAGMENIMNEEQEKNLLNHADFLDNVVTKSVNGIHMAIYYAPIAASERQGIEEVEWRTTLQNTVDESDRVDPHEVETIEDADCDACACAIGWTVANPDLPPAEKFEEWDDYSSRIFGVNNFDQGEYCFSAELNITDASIVADRMRKVAEAWPEHLEIEDEFLFKKEK